MTNKNLKLKSEKPDETDIKPEDVDEGPHPPEEWDDEPERSEKDEVEEGYLDPDSLWYRANSPTTPNMTI